jgi:phosphotriesterase-related protein
LCLGLDGFPEKDDRPLKTKKIPTVTGTVDSDKLGTTLIHEHILFGKMPSGKEQESIQFAVKMLQDAVRVGIETIVDLSPTRDILLYKKIAEQVPINIIVSTGTYLEKLMDDSYLQMSGKEFEDHMRKEITTGIQGTNIRAGIIKVAGDKTPLTKWEKERFIAAAHIQKELSVPIATHAIFKPGDQFNLLVANDANPDHVFFSHTEARFGWGGLTREQIGQELLRITRAGGRILFNNFGYEFDTPWEDLVYLIRLLCENDCEKNVLTSMDTYWHWENGKIIVNVDNKYPDTRNKTYAYAITDAIPNLLKAGFSARNIQNFFIKNPASFFSWT